MNWRKKDGIRSSTAETNLGLCIARKSSERVLKEVLRMPLLKLITVKLFNNVSLEKLQSEYGY